MNFDLIKDTDPAFTHNWDILFPPFEATLPSANPLEFPNGLGSPWGLEWFPATSCDLDLAGVNSKTIRIGNMNIKIPTDQPPKQVNITFFDNQQHLLESWFEDWVNRVIFAKSQGIEVLSELVKLVYIKALDIKKTPVKFYAYWVYPDGNFPVRYNSTGDILLFNQSLAIVGDAINI